MTRLWSGKTLKHHFGHDIVDWDPTMDVVLERCTVQPGEASTNYQDVSSSVIEHCAMVLVQSAFRTVKMCPEKHSACFEACVAQVIRAGYLLCNKLTQ